MIALVAMFSLFSCKQDPSVTFAYTITSSEDLLNYLIPVVTYSDANGQIITDTINKQEWRKSNSEGISTTINGVTQTVKGLGEYYWQKRVHFDALSVSSDMSLKYIPQLTPDNNTEATVFTSSLTCLIGIESEDDGINTAYSDTNTSFSLTVKEDSIVSTVIQAISSLTLSKRYFVDGDGKVKVTLSE